MLNKYTNKAFLFKSASELFKNFNGAAIYL